MTTTLLLFSTWVIFYAVKTGFEEVVKGLQAIYDKLDEKL